ncbi:signal peptidase I [Specibacter sp. NPDC057265]|uniref:signal peptidase I n=1 Tax=Specibacter sp. NPDC057265 TaxID=3346075 RepID=UPI00363BE789
MQESVPGESNHAAGPDGKSSGPAGNQPRQNGRARRFGSPRHAAGASSSALPPGDGGDAPAGGAGTERLGTQLLAWGRELLTIVVIAVVLSFLIKTFLFRAFYIPSGSMENTLQINDRIFVNLLVPEPISIKRGDVVVFKDTQGWLAEEPAQQNSGSWLSDAAIFIGLAPDNSQQHLVKRVIGLPGDRVVCCDAEGRLSVNGQALDEPYLYPGAAPSETAFAVTVPEGQLWVMGDHRNNSQDSRFHDAYNGTGFVPVEDVEGRAAVIAWPLAHWGILGNHPEVFKDVPDAPAGSLDETSPAAP